MPETSPRARRPKRHGDAIFSEEVHGVPVGQRGNIATRPAVVVLGVILFALWFGALETRGLFWPDEGRYAEIAREMLASGDYVTPRLNGLKYFEKPPLQYWFSALVFHVFGPDEWTARLWPATTGFILIVVAVGLWWRWSGPDTGLMVGSVLASAWGVLLGAQILTLDIGLAFFHSLALLAFIGAHRLRVTPKAKAWAMTLIWATMAGAVLSKGLVGIVLPGLTLIVYAAVERDLSILRSTFTLRGIVVFLALTLPWFVLVQRANPEFFDLFFVQEHFRRYLEPGHNRPGQWWYFLAIGALFLLPWTASVPGALKDAWHAPRQGTLRVERLLVIWVLVVLVFFSLSRSKLPFYILPALPAVAWILAVSSPARHPKMASDAAIATGIAGIVMIALAMKLDAIEKVRELGAGVAAYPPFMVAAGGLLVMGSVFALALRARLVVTTRIALIAFANVVALQIMLTGAHVFDAYFSAEQAIDTFVGEKESFSAEPPFYSVGMLDQSVPFYLQRAVTQVASKGELADGIAAEPDKYIEQMSVFEARWRAAGEAYAVMSPKTYGELEAAGLPMTVMAVDPRRVFVARGRWPPVEATAPVRTP